jgi:hypothetical protein
MLQGFDAIVSQKLSEPIAPVHRQDGHERIELLGAARLRVEMGAGTLPLTMVSLPVFVRARAVDVAEIATWIEPVAQATFERLGVWKTAIRLVLPNRLAIIGDFEDAADSRRERHLSEIGPERQKKFLSEPGRTDQPATLRTIANGDPWPEVAHQGLLNASRQEQSLRDAPADPWIEHWHAERHKIPGVAGGERQVVDEGGRGEKPVHR